MLELQEILDEDEEQELDQEGPRDERTDSDEDFEKMQQIEEAWRDYSSQTRRRTAAPTETDRKLEAMQNTAARPISLQDYLIDRFSARHTP